ncbi:hypothetical protein [Treponema sp.]|uniref:hypothetical protein n=1 Tax=Treponema sp. TaxID=166 RepID=UPI0038900335
MANGLEDLREKNKDVSSAKNDSRYGDWRVFQGREDAEMLKEKSSGWSSKKANRGEYDSWGDDE